MGISALHSYGIGLFKVQYPEIKPEKAASTLTNLDATTTKETAPAAGIETIVEPVEPDESNDRESGVIRNLIDGHFRGVADVRLRINFNDEITALEAEKATEITETGISEISRMITSESETFLHTEGLDEGISAAISDGLQAFTLVDTGAVSSSSDVMVSTDSDPIAQLQSTFDAYIESIRNALAALSQSTSGETTEFSETTGLNQVITDETTGSVTTEESISGTDWQLKVEQFIAELTSSFETALNALKKELENLTVLPELSEPSGNGRAYGKFLSIYNEIQQAGADNSETIIVDVTR